MAAGGDGTTELRVLSAGAMSEIILELGEAHQRATGTALACEFTRSPLVLDRVRAGEIVDLIVTTEGRIEALAREGKVMAGSAKVLARSGIGVAVRAGRPKPDIATVAAFVASVRNAQSIAVADPSFGTASGLYLVELFERLGLTDELRPKLRPIGAQQGKPLVVCAAVADGRAELGIQQIAEIVPVAGVDIVGPLPPEIQHATAFAIAVASTAPSPDAARAFIALAASAAAREVIAAHGMEPVAG
jgi:molybdate transport system substrate-binding protein